ERDITGVLYFNNEYFLQCLEGDREKVNLLYNNIIKDHRHNRVVILDYQEIRNRDFQDWSMGYIPISSITKPLVLKFSSSSDFNPYQLSDSSAYMLLLELKNAYLQCEKANARLRGWQRITTKLKHNNRNRRGSMGLETLRVDSPS
ncbi:TPA: BLUF domain-containing protein, partial [Vibrio cholerae]